MFINFYKILFNKLTYLIDSKIVLKLLKKNSNIMRSRLFIFIDQTEEYLKIYFLS